MTDSTAGDAIETTPSIWRREVRIDLRGLLKAMGKALLDIRAANWDTLAKDVVDMAAAVGLEQPGAADRAFEQAAKLVSVALNRGLFELIRAHQHLFGYGLVEPPTAAGGEAPGALAVGADDVQPLIELDRDLFLQPARAPAVEALHSPVAAWLVSRGLDGAQAHTIAMRLGRYYAAALAGEWRRSPRDYAAVQAHLDSAASLIDEPRRDWDRYRAELMRRVEEPLFADSFSLSQVYQPLRAWHGEDCEDDSEDGMSGRHALGRETIGRHGMKKQRRTVVDAMGALDGWLKGHDPEDAIRVVSGGPGAGKSSLARMLAASRAEAGDRVLLIELHLFGLADDLGDAVNRYARGLDFRHDVLSDRAADPLLLIFDGLDELSIRGSAGADVVRNLCDDLRSLLSTHNRRDLRVRAVLLGRKVVVQSLAHRYRRAGQLLTLLPYHLEDAERGEYHDPGARLAIDQRQQWWRCYGERTGRPYTGLPDVLQRVHALTAQPLLNYLVAIALDRGQVDFSDDTTSLNDVYGSLIEQVFTRVHAARRYAPEAPGQPLADLEDVELEDYHAFLRCVAVEAWHGEGRTASLSGIQSRLPEPLVRKIELLQRRAEDALSRLIAAFYFRQVGVGEKTFEFTHQSFAEYLVAQEILTFLEDLTAEAEAHARSKGRRGWSAEQQLTEWAALLGPSAIEPNVFDFVLDGLRKRAREDTAGLKATLGVLVELFAGVLEHDFPAAALAGGQYFDQSLARSRNAGEALFISLTGCSAALGVVTSVPGLAERFGTWLRRVHPQRMDRENTMVLRHAGHIDLSRARLEFADLGWANLASVALRGAGLHHANFWGADLTGADLWGAKLMGTDLLWADLTGADLMHANLKGANLMRANLTDANLTGANLTGADLTGANLTGARFTRARITETLGLPDELRSRLASGRRRRDRE